VHLHLILEVVMIDITQKIHGSIFGQSETIYHMVSNAKNKKKKEVYVPLGPFFVILVGYLYDYDSYRNLLLYFEYIFIYNIFFHQLDTQHCQEGQP